MYREVNFKINFFATKNNKKTLGTFNYVSFKEI